MRYQIQVHFENKGQYNFEYEPDKGEHINDFLLKYDDQKDEKFILTGDEDTAALISVDQVTAIIAIPVKSIKVVSEKVRPMEELNAFD